MAGKEIITIGRQFGSGGHEVGRRLAAELGLKLYDKELLKMMAQESNICEQVLEDYDEKNTGSLLYSIMMDVYPSMNYVGNTLQRQIYELSIDCFRQYLCEWSMAYCIIRRFESKPVELCLHRSAR